jgi:hypothetical protein
MNIQEKIHQNDAGASLTTSKTNVEAEDSWKTSSASFLIFKFSLGVDALNINETI